MPKYRKKPVVVEAFRWLIDTAPQWFRDKDYLVYVVDPNPEAVIVTLEGDMRAKHGDYIIRGVEGEIYPCKPSIFEATYEAVDEADNSELSAICPVPPFPGIRGGGEDD
jgi:hypothetical protein